MTLYEVEKSTAEWESEIKDLQTSLEWARWENKDLAAELDEAQARIRMLAANHAELKRRYLALEESVRQARALARWEGCEKVERALISILEASEM